VRPVQTPGVLDDGSLPGNRHREYQGVEPWIVEALADEPSGGHEHTRLVGREFVELREGVAAPAWRDIAVQRHDGRHMGLKLRRKALEVIASLGEDKRDAPLGEQLPRVSHDQLGASVVSRQRGVDLLDGRVGRQRGRVEGRVATDDA
jgi:hypothetical protein